MDDHTAADGGVADEMCDMLTNLVQVYSRLEAYGVETSPRCPSPERVKELFHQNFHVVDLTVEAILEEMTSQQEQQQEQQAQVGEEFAELFDFVCSPAEAQNRTADNDYVEDEEWPWDDSEYDQRTLTDEELSEIVRKIELAEAEKEENDRQLAIRLQEQERNGSCVFEALDQILAAKMHEEELERDRIAQQQLEANLRFIAELEAEERRSQTHEEEDRRLAREIEMQERLEREKLQRQEEESMELIRRLEEQDQKDREQRASPAAGAGSSYDIQGRELSEEEAEAALREQCEMYHRELEEQDRLQAQSQSRVESYSQESPRRRQEDTIADEAIALALQERLIKKHTDARDASNQFKVDESRQAQYEQRLSQYDSNYRPIPMGSTHSNPTITSLPRPSAAPRMSANHGVSTGGMPTKAKADQPYLANVLKPPPPPPLPPALAPAPAPAATQRVDVRHQTPAPQPRQRPLTAQHADPTLRQAAAVATTARTATAATETAPMPMSTPMSTPMPMPMPMSTPMPMPKTMPGVDRSQRKGQSDTRDPVPLHCGGEVENFDIHLCAEKIDIRRVEKLLADLTKTRAERKRRKVTAASQDDPSFLTLLKDLERIEFIEETLLAYQHKCKDIIPDEDGHVTMEVLYFYKDEPRIARMYTKGVNIAEKVSDDVFKLDKEDRFREATIQHMKRELRPLMMGAFAHDIDCVNSEVRILCSLAVKIGMPLGEIPELKKYFDERESIHDVLVRLHKNDNFGKAGSKPLTREGAKRLVTLIVSGGSYNTWLKQNKLKQVSGSASFGQKIDNNMKKLRDAVLSHPDFAWLHGLRSDVEEQERNKRDVQSVDEERMKICLMNRLVQASESEILNIIHEVFFNCGWEVRAKVFDGIIAEPGKSTPGGSRYPRSDPPLAMEMALRLAEEHCALRGWDTQLIEKPLYGLQDQKIGAIEGWEKWKRLFS